MTVLVTGHQGYLGGVVVRLLRQVGIRVLGVDTGFFRDCLLYPADPADATVACDIRDMDGDTLAGVSAVVHLAALSNDPLGGLDPRWTREINVDATVRLAELAKRHGVRRFVFASSCIMYGLLEEGLADEETPLRPTTDYARSKVDAERALRALADDRFSPILLRNGTIYGAAPYMRLDTVFNDFVASAVCEGKVVVRGDGAAWRPVVEVRDAAQAVLAALQAPATVHNQAVNVGADHLNRRIADLAASAAAVVPGTTVEILNLPAQDQRTYRADFAKCARLFPRLRFRGVEAGGRDLASALRGSVLARGAARRQFLRVDRLRELLDNARLDRSLRWRSRPP